jgi:hypothetical protein
MTKMQEVDMPNRPACGIKSKNRIQYETGPEGRDVFREYWIHEWDGKGYDVHEHINDLDQAVKRARELGYNDDAKELERFRPGGE